MAAQETVLQVENIKRYFDVSKPWLNRVIEGGGRHRIAHAREEGRDGALDVKPRARLDLDDLGAEEREQLPRRRADEPPAEVRDADARER